MLRTTLAARDCNHTGSAPPQRAQGHPTGDALVEREQASRKEEWSPGRRWERPKFSRRELRGIRKMRDRLLPFSNDQISSLSMHQKVRNYVSRVDSEEFYETFIFCTSLGHVLKIFKITFHGWYLQFDIFVCFSYSGYR